MNWTAGRDVRTALLFCGLSLIKYAIWSNYADKYKKSLSPIAAGVVTTSGKSLLNFCEHVGPEARLSLVGHSR